MKPSKPQPEPEYLTPREAAVILRVDERTVYEWLRQKKLPSIKFGRLWRIRAVDVHR